MRSELKVLNAASAFNIFAIGLFGPFYAVFVDEIGGGAFIAGSSYSIYAIAAGILLFITSRFEDRVDHTDKLIVVGYLLATIAYFSYTLVERPVHLFAVQGLVGIATSIKSPAFDELYSRNLDRGKEASEWGIWESMAWIVTGFSALTAGFVVEQFGFDTLFVLMGTFSMFGTILSLRLLGAEDPDQ